MDDRCSQYTEKAQLLKALGHPLRLCIVHSLLKEGCRRVSCMEEHTGQSQSCISQHLTRLKGLGIVKSERSGNEVYYEIADRRVASVVAALFDEREEDYQ